MGKKIVNRVRRLGWKTKVSLVTAVTLIVSLALLQGWYRPRLANATTVTMSGASWTVPAGVYSMTVECWGGGGGGGGIAAGASNTVITASGGGGGGAYSTQTIPVTPGQIYYYTIGAAGSAGTSGGGNGGAGTASVFKSTDNATILLQANGGTGGNGAASGVAATGGAGGTAGTYGSTNTSGGSGATGATSGAGTAAGGGGAGAQGGNGSAATGATGGAGGVIGTGSVAGGAGATGNGTTPGAAGTPGGGGAGVEVRGKTAYAGGAGGAGRINITYTVATAPTVSTPTATSIAASTATLGGTITTNGGAPVTEYGVVWSTSNNLPTITDTKVAAGSSDPGSNYTFTQPVTGLPSGTTIYYRAYATNAMGTSYSSSTPTSFTTLAAPTLASPTAASISAAGATLGATITSNGGGGITDYGVVWNTTGSPSLGNGTKLQKGSTDPGNNYTFTLASGTLPAGTKIYYAGYATNSAGTGYSVAGSFYTEPATQASNVQFSGITGSGMTVSWTSGSGDGVIVLMKAASAVTGTPADGTFTYTASPSFGSGTLVGDGYTVFKGNGNSVTVTGLTTGTTYYVSVFAYSGSSTTSGVNLGTSYLTTGAATGNALAANTAPIIGTVTVTPTVGSYTGPAPSVSAQVTLSGGTVSGCEYTSDGLTWSAGTLTGSASPWSCSANPTGLTGTRTFNIRATAPGGTGTGSAVTRTVDGTAPAVSGQSPADGASVPLDALNLTATATDGGSGVSQYRIVLYSSSHVQISDTGWLPTTGSISYAPTGLAYNTAYYWDLSVRDSIGNVSPVSELLFSTKGACTHNDPSLSLSTSSNAISTKIQTDAGSAVYNLKVTNNDVGGCADATFNLTAANINNTDGTKFNSPTLSGSTMTLPVGTSQTVTMTVSAKTANGGDVSGVAYSTGTASAANHNPVSSNQVLTVLNVAGCTKNAPLLTIGPNTLYATRGGSTVYTVSVKNTDVGASCTPTTFTLSDAGDSNSALFSSSLSATSLTLAPGQANTVFLTVAAGSTASNGSSDVTSVSVAASNHASPPNSTATTTVGDLMLHNSDNLNSAKWGSAGWGIPGGRYGEIVCSTCHVPGGSSTNNIKKLREAIYTPYTSTHQHFPGEGKRIAFTKTTGGDPSAATYGWDATTTKTVDPLKICEACHTYDANAVNGAKHHAQTSASLYNHFDGQDCIRCHKHNLGFGTPAMACNFCHGDPAATVNADGSNRYVVAPPANINQASGTLTGTGQVSNDPKVGAHQTHMRYFNGFSNYSTYDYRCQTCHGTLPTTNTHLDGGSNLNLKNTFQSMATRNGSYAASYNASNQSCNVYCHNPAGSGGTLKSSLDVGKNTTPSWTDASYLPDGTGKTQNNCNRCHLVPGDAGFAYQSVHGSMVTSTANDCSGCHGHNGDLTGVLGQRHLDGIRYASGNCNGCHGYDTTDSGTTWNPALSGGSGSGAHVKHINFIKARLGIASLTPGGQTFGVGEPAAICGTCHTNTGSQHQDTGREIIFGTGGTTNTMGAGYSGSMSLLFGSSNPSFDVNLKSCSNVSCHYSTTPSWY